MSSFRIHLDSRSRENYTSISQSTFSLSKSICDVKGVRVKHVQIANTIFNIRLGLNDQITLSVDNGVSYTNQTYITPGFYTNSEYTSLLNTYLQGAMSVSTTCVALNSTNNTLSWTLPTGLYIDGLNSTSRHVLGLGDVNSTGSFTTKLFLGSPMSVSFVCPQLQSTYNVFASDSMASRIEPFLSVPLKSGYGLIEYFEPTTQYFIQLSNVTLSSLDFRIVDSFSGQIINEIGNWSIELEVFV